MIRTWIVFSFGFICALLLTSIYNWIGEPVRIKHFGRPVILAFGDSITEGGFGDSGWLGLLSNWYHRRVDVINRGFSGYNSRWALNMIEDVVLAIEPDLVFVFFGANDAADSQIAQHISLSEYSSNLARMVSRIKQRVPDVDVILITPPPIWEPAREESNLLKGKSLLIDRTNQRAFQYAQACVNVAVESDVPVIDLWRGLDGETEMRSRYLSDGLHLNADGNKALYSFLKQTIVDQLPKWTPERISLHKPQWWMASADPELTKVPDW